MVYTSIYICKMQYAAILGWICAIDNDDKG